MAKVLVTGGTGFVAGYVLVDLLKAGHEVHTTVRNLKRKDDVLAVLKTSGVEPGQQLSVFSADLTKDVGWSEAIQGCEYVLHIASPFPSGDVKNEDELIIPARDGTLRILRAARAAGVRRVVMTSSFAAVAYGYPDKERVYNESNWTDPSKTIPAYIKSKAVAEKAAWEYVNGEGAGLELTVVCPTGIFGPAQSKDISSSIELVRMLLNGAMPACPKIYFGVVDVRDLASFHLLAMIHPKAGGERFIASGRRIYSLFDIAKVLRKNLGQDAVRVPRFEFPSWMVRLMSKFAPKMKGFLPNLDVKRIPSSEKAKELLGWNPRSVQETIADTGKSLIKIDLVKPVR